MKTEPIAYIRFCIAIEPFCLRARFRISPQDDICAPVHPTLHNNTSEI